MADGSWMVSGVSVCGRCIVCICVGRSMLLRCAISLAQVSLAQVALAKVSGESVCHIVVTFAQRGISLAQVAMAQVLLGPSVTFNVTCHFHPLRRMPLRRLSLHHLCGSAPTIG